MQDVGVPGRCSTDQAPRGPMVHPRRSRGRRGRDGHRAGAHGDDTRLVAASVGDRRMSGSVREAPAPALIETPLYMQAGPESVFAVYTSSTSPAPEIGVVLAHSGANNFSAHRNGVWTRLARQLAHEGIPSLRFDFAGT